MVLVFLRLKNIHLGQRSLQGGKILTLSCILWARKWVHRQEAQILNSHTSLSWSESIGSSNAGLSNNGAFLSIWFLCWAAMVVETFVFGTPVIVVMLGVPIWHSIGECRKGRVKQLRLIRWWLTCGLIVFVSLFSGLVFGIGGFVLSNLPASPSPKPSQLSTDCRILSSGIDLRSSKICTPQSLSNVEGGMKIRKFRCYFEYYWASVFKVEFKPYSSDLLVEAVSEVPKAALPAYCRPGFGPIWILKEKYQVNVTYPCKYSPGSSGMVDIADDLFAKCKWEKVTAFNLIKQSVTVLFFSEQWIFSSTSQAGLVFRKALTSISFAAGYSVLVTGFARIVCEMRFMLYGSNNFSVVEKVYFEVRLQITCMLIATLVGTSWYNGHLEGLKLFMHQLFATHR